MKILLAISATFIVTAAFAGDLPDRRLTPGVADPALTAARLCAPKFTTKSIRNVSAATKRQAYAEYHMTAGKAPCPCEVDHLISLELGGSNDIGNLWPESYTSRWNARLKDRLENRLHKEVCAGTLKLGTAQRAISTDWIGAYKARFGKEK